MTKRYIKNELKRSKRFDHVTEDIMSLFWSWKKLSVKHYFPANFLCRHGEPQALATEIWGKICPPSDQEAIV